MKTFGNDGATAQGFDVGDFVEDEEEERVRQVVEMVDGGRCWFGVDFGGQIWSE